MPESPLTPTYDPAPVEVRWSSLWEQRGFFRVDASRAGKAYCIVIPPPNITGSLHLGHALNNTLQDILIRWRRMCGDAALWIPGTDHAGIATQNVVERQLKAEKMHRDQLGRAAFIQRVWQWRNESGRTIITQLKKLGASCDWSRERFTMDEGLSAAVREVFVRLHQDGLIYRSERLINWCPRCQTALSDIEVEHEETRGKMYRIKYPLDDEPNEFLTVATTRPETMLGDTAVAVHSDDPRFNRFIGRRVCVPLTKRTVPVVGDAILVDREFGTGAVKITPGHDFNDYEAGRRHQLPMLSLLDRRGHMNESGLRLAQVLPDHQSALLGKSAVQARALIVPHLQEKGLLIAIEDHRHAVGKCYRCKTVVEPRLSPQWFVNINAPERSLAAPAIEAVRSGRIRLIPESWANNYFGWMEQIQDWCISRQIWWGHQIPAWYCKHCITKSVSGSLSDQDLMFSDNISLDVKPIVNRDRPPACPQCGSNDLVQDPDVLDTWFSSALWPFSTLGWPRHTEELARFYPTSALVTSFDILFFWVARMIMMGLYVMKEVPFRNVYIHALVRDAEGQKMSKSKGNVIDPLEVMNKYGTDALRFTLASMASPGRDIRLSEERIAGYRNFANKLWNAERFILMNLDGKSDSGSASNQSLHNRWIMSRLQHAVGEVARSLEAYRFDEAANQLYHFIWNEYCDWYIECAKLSLGDQQSPAAAETRATLARSFEALLRLLHPFMPYITEALWQAIPHQGESIVVAPYPAPHEKLIDDDAERDFGMLQETVVGFRNLRSVHGMAPSQKLPGAIVTSSDEIKHHLDKNTQLVVGLARLGRLTINPAERPVHTCSGSIILSGEHKVELLLIPPAKTMNVAKEHAQESAKKEKRLKELTSQIERDEKTLANAQFLAKAPPHEVEKIKIRQLEFKLERESLIEELSRVNKQT